MIPVPTETLAALVDGTHSQPHAVLGPHADADGVTIRVLRPDATAVDVVVGGQNQPMEHEHAGVWVTELAGTDIPDYRLAVAYGGDKLPADDPYRFLPTLGEIDQHLIAEGRHALRPGDSLRIPGPGTSGALITGSRGKLTLSCR